jgi:hypothetical protein
MTTIWMNGAIARVAAQALMSASAARLNANAASAQAAIGRYPSAEISTGIRRPAISRERAQRDHEKPPVCGHGEGDALRRQHGRGKEVLIEENSERACGIRQWPHPSGKRKR